MKVVGPDIELQGRKKDAEKLIPLSFQIMAVLENLMEFQGLTQYQMKVLPRPGATITCKKSFGLKSIIIDVPIKYNYKLDEYKGCFCNWNFSTGWIVNVRPEKLDEDIPLYDVIICQNKAFYVLKENVLASDFTEYLPSQSVIVVPYFEMEFKNKNFTKGSAIGCNVHTSDKTLIDEAWRTSIRIIPWCGAYLPRYINYKYDIQNG